MSRIIAHKQKGIKVVIILFFQWLRMFENFHNETGKKREGGSGVGTRFPANTGKTKIW